MGEDVDSMASSCYFFEILNVSYGVFTLYKENRSGNNTPFVLRLILYLDN